MLSQLKSGQRAFDEIFPIPLTILAWIIVLFIGSVFFDGYSGAIDLLIAVLVISFDSTTAISIIKLILRSKKERFKHSVKGVFKTCLSVFFCLLF